MLLHLEHGLLISLNINIVHSKIHHGFDSLCLLLTVALQAVINS